MNIEKVESYVVRQHLEGQSFAYAQDRYYDRTILLLKVVTDEGIVGWGEAFGPALIHRATIEHVYAPLLVGKDPFDSQVIWDEFYNKLRDHGQKGLNIEALSAIDIALWDIKGKAAGLPVYKLLGGAPRQTITPYATGFYRRKDGTLKDLIEEAVGYAEKGFKGMKLKLGFGIEDDVHTTREVRKAIGDDLLLMVDTNHAYNASQAIHLGRQIEEFDIRWFEEPVPPEDIEGYCEVKNQLNIPIAGGEAEFTRYGFHRFLANRPVDIVQPDCTVSGGISEFQKIAALCTLHNLQCYPHVWGSAIAYATGIHCAFTLPHFPPSLTPSPMLLETDQSPNIFRDKLALNPIERKNGIIELPQEPGLGVMVDEKLIHQYAI